MRQRQAIFRNGNSPNPEKNNDKDPFDIFEECGQPSRGVTFQRASFQTKILQRGCCSRRAKRCWLVSVWILIITVMFFITCKIMLQINYETENQAFFSAPPFFLPSNYNKLFWNIVVRGGNRNQPKKLKRILYLNQFWDFDHFQFGEGHQPFLDAHCPVSDCVAVQDRPNILNGVLNEDPNAFRASFDAVLIHGPMLDLSDKNLLHEIQKWRRPNQRFVYMTMESPQSLYASGDHRIKNFYNWTMTYRLDSDLPRPYGFFEPIFSAKQHATPHARYYPLQWQPDQDFGSYDEEHLFRYVLPYKDQAFYKLADRPKKVAWIVSRCESPSRREDYVAKLREYISVDIMGACGDIPCNVTFHEQNRNEQQQYNNGMSDDTTFISTDNCTSAVERDYKFYLAFENSFCDDYVTEKFFQRMQGKHNPLVVVLGGANYSRIAPPHSHLNALDFSSPQALAAKLHELDRNKTAYLSYFGWRDRYRVRRVHSMCRLCEMLHDPTMPPKVYPSISEWHSEKSQCRDQVIWNVMPSKNNSDDDGKLLDGVKGDDHYI